MQRQSVFRRDFRPQTEKEEAMPELKIYGHQNDKNNKYKRRKTIEDLFIGK